MTHHSTWRETADAGVGVSVGTDYVALTVQREHGTVIAYLGPLMALAVAGDLEAAARAALANRQEAA